MGLLGPGWTAAWRDGIATAGILERRGPHSPASSGEPSVSEGYRWEEGRHASDDTGSGPSRARDLRAGGDQPLGSFSAARLAPAARVCVFAASGTGGGFVRGGDPGGAPAQGAGPPVGQPRARRAGGVGSASGCPPRSGEV